MAFLGWGLAMAAEGPVASTAGLEWHRFPDQTKFEVRGLPWFEANQPRFWRLPAAGFETLPKGVQNRAKVPSGGRIRLRSDTTRLVLRAATAGGGLVNRLDVLVGSELRRAVSATKVGDGTELVLFEAMPRVERDITVYLPHRQDIVVTAVGVDPGARFSPVQAVYSRAWPVVYYGSSVCEGNGASGAGLTYPAELGRHLNLDFVNLGFGGAGKAEPEVVKLVSSQPACAYVFDLGKSYGNQDAAAFRTMLQRVRREHPEVPLLVITPITS
ncbi:MAG: hypothetical protein HZC55_00490, partial [Verrucomicrobia bacterium]|nr:hypothetical protein [Verrucomicrobiota bacterium]